MTGASAGGRRAPAPGTTGRPVRTVVHVLRDGEVHNPDRILYGRIPGFRP